MKHANVKLINIIELHYERSTKEIQLSIIWKHVLIDNLKAVETGLQSKMAE